jgi:ribonuclease P protein component
LVLHMLPPDSRTESPAPADAPAKVGFVVSRGVGHAVVRNRVVRRLRHLMHEHLGNLEPGSLLVVRATPRAAEASSQTLADDLDACLRSLERRGSSDRVGRSRP